MLVQTLDAVALRFQNRRLGDRDPLAQLEIDPLRPLNNLPAFRKIPERSWRLDVPESVHAGIQASAAATRPLLTSDASAVGADIVQAPQA